MSTDDQDDIAEIEISTSEEIPEKENSNDPPADSLRILEALLFASDEIMTSSRLKAILPENPDARQIRKMVEKINTILQKERHPFEIVEIGGGYQFRTVSYYHPWVRQIFKEKAAKKLSIQSLECLAIIAYKQPLSKAEIEAIRGVVSDGAMKTLLEKRLVTITGRSDKPGRPLQYGTTQDFLKYFGLNKIEDLPRLEEFEAIAREKISELSLDELQEEQTVPHPEGESAVTDTEIIARQEFSNDESTQTVAGQPDEESSFELTSDTAVIPKENDQDTSKEPLSGSDESSEVLNKTVDIVLEDKSEAETFEIISVVNKGKSDDEATFEAAIPVETFTAPDTAGIVLDPIASSVQEVPVSSSHGKDVDYTDDFVFNDGITKEEMTETAIQERTAITERENFDSLIAKKKDETATVDSQPNVTPDSSDEAVLEVFIPPPEAENKNKNKNKKKKKK